MWKQRNVQYGCSDKSGREESGEVGVGTEQITKALRGQGEDSGLHSQDKRETLLGFMQGNNNVIYVYKI